MATTGYIKKWQGTSPHGIIDTILTTTKKSTVANITGDTIGIPLPATEYRFDAHSAAFRNYAKAVYVRFHNMRIDINGEPSYFTESQIAMSPSGTAKNRSSRTLGHIPTSSFFNEDNKTQKQITIPVYFGDGYGSVRYHYLIVQDSESTWYDWDTAPTGQYLFFETVYTFKVEPLVELGTPVYAYPQMINGGAYTVPIVSAEAQYGGDITEITLTIGQNSVVKTYSAESISDDSISVTPTVAGTFTPTLTVKDSRDVIKTITLDPITVADHSVEVNSSVDRCKLTGVIDNEGTYGLITANILYQDAFVTLEEPSVYINGTVTNNVTWYSSYNSVTGVSSPISDWETLTPTDHAVTVYGIVNENFVLGSSYQITLVAEDSDGLESEPITQILPLAFYTIDFKAGGKEISFGALADDDLSNVNGKDYSDIGLFKCRMGTDFTDMTVQEVNDFIDSLDL